LSEPIVRIAVVGAGGVGGFFGAKLALADNDVVFIARGRHLAAIRTDGLTVESVTGAMRVAPARATDDPGSIPPVDVVMLCVKLWDVEAAAAQIGPLLAAGGVVIPFQNGLDSPEILKRALGDDRVLGGVAYIAATIGAPGVIAHTGTMARLIVGAFPGGPAERAEAFVAACSKADINVELSTDIRRALWEKFCFLAAFSGCTCLARQPIGAIRADGDLRATFEGAVREAWSIGRALGVPLADDYVERQLAAADKLPAEMKASMLHDLAAGRRLEAPWLSGAVARMADEAGVAAPISRTLYAAVKPYVDGVAHAMT
jgi:2-dehydropantoate 2-reductase